MGRAQVQEGGKGEGKAQPPRGAQGQARMLLLRGRGELGVGASPLAPRVPASAPLLHFVQTSLSLREGWAEEDKNHQAKQCCISIIPSRLGEGAQEETGPLRVQPEPKPGLLASSLVLLLLHLAVSLRTRCCGERGYLAGTCPSSLSGMAGTGQTVSPSGCALCYQTRLAGSAKPAFASVFVFFQLDLPTHLCNMCCYHISLLLPVRKPGSER